MARRITGTTLRFDNEWVVGLRIGQGGFGQVYEVAGGDRAAVAKFIPKAPGTDRELLFVDLSDSVNVVPIIDKGEDGDHWILVMPRAEKSLREHLATAGIISVEDAVGILIDVVDALVSLEGRVVHRDLKPENVLLLDGAWCLADFGISRYAEATTASDTQKFAMSAAYAAPERWRHDRATSAADVYAVGVMAFEMIAGVKPFQGPDWDDYQQQHLHENPPALSQGPTRLRALIEECLYKAPGARPSAANLRARLDSALADPPAPGLAALVEANRAEVERRAEVARLESAGLSAAQTRTSLAAAGRSIFDQISMELLKAISSAAPAATTTSRAMVRWELTLGTAKLTLKEPRDHGPDDWGGRYRPSFDVVLAAELNLKIPPSPSQYEGRSHSLWYCDAERAGEFGWYETAFMFSPWVSMQGRQAPFALSVGAQSADALRPGIAQCQLAWPFSSHRVGDLEDLIERWARWLGEASQGRLGRPRRMPERNDCHESFRQR